jgi:hypothetical protein
MQFRPSGADPLLVALSSDERLLVTYGTSNQPSEPSIIPADAFTDFTCLTRVPLGGTDSGQMLTFCGLTIDDTKPAKVRFILNSCLTFQTACLCNLSIYTPPFLVHREMEVTDMNRVSTAYDIDEQGSPDRRKGDKKGHGPASSMGRVQDKVLCKHDVRGQLQELGAQGHDSLLKVSRLTVIFILRKSYGVWMWQLCMQREYGRGKPC